ncbi:hypothetical protein HDV01_000932 [Terramyces sp. JEL0728]|nr:hypothetical protein HDV01_000932 [Terramyces sp. JEL0728]
MPPIKQDLLFASSVLSFITQSFQLAKYVILTRQTPVSDVDSIIFYTKLMMVLDLTTNLVAGLAMNVLTGYFVKGAIGSNSQLFQVSGRKLDPQLFIKLFRLFVFLYTVTMYSLWITFGVQTEEHYILYRRVIYYSYMIITGIMSPTIYHIFMGAIIKKLKEHYSDIGEAIPISLHYLILLKRTLTRTFSLAITISMFLKVFANDYLQNYLYMVQIITNLFSFYVATVLSTYGIYKAFPSLITSYTSNKSHTIRSNKNSVVVSDDVLCKGVAKTQKIAANTVVVPKTVKYSNEALQ